MVFSRSISFRSSLMTLALCGLLGGCAGEPVVESSNDAAATEGIPPAEAGDEVARVAETQPPSAAARRDKRPPRAERVMARHAGKSLRTKPVSPGPRVRRYTLGNRHTVRLTSRVFHIDRIYKSMKGPYNVYDFPLLITDEPELVWVTAFRAKMLNADGRSAASQEFMCHSNLDLVVDQYEETFGTMLHRTNRLFTLSQGQFDIELPQGFGIPMMSNQTVRLAAQVLNHNVTDRELDVRHDVSVDFVRDAELTIPMRPLFTTYGEGLVLVEGEGRHFDVDEADPDAHGVGCLVGQDASGGDLDPDGLGRKFAGHWVVPPGREENHTLVTHLMRLPFDTTIHYIAVHLHPFAESLELRDLTTGETLFKSEVDEREGAIGIDRVEHYSSSEGIPVFVDHEYEIVSVYENTSGEEQDSMAVMYMYLLDKQWRHPS